MIKKILILLTLLPVISSAQSYTSYFTGNNTDVVTTPMGGICIMGGATEDDYAMKWFLQRANGGDILVLRTTGSNGYNTYLYSGLGVPVNSVETIVCNSPLASNESYIIQKINQAEAIWFAGGDQWTYISYWRNTPINNAINQAIEQRKIVIGGTSAGMAIQGKYYFSAQNGTVTSSTALANPFNNVVTIDSSAFINNNFLSNTITDTHFDNPDRKGRLVSFLARIKTDYGVFAKGIACDEYTAVCIDTNGIARIFGGHPTYDDNAYFIQSNCELTIQTPENCSVGNPLTWNLGGLALKSYQIKGDSTGNKTFNLKTWESGTGGNWYNWYVSNGIFNEQIGTAINCSPLAMIETTNNADISISPNPTRNVIFIKPNNLSFPLNEVNLFNTLGQKFTFKTFKNGNQFNVDISSLQNGIYLMMVEGENSKKFYSKIMKN
jgi:cyanophycinase-like exopeptidase